MASTAFAGGTLTANRSIAGGQENPTLPQAIADMKFEVAAPSRAPQSALIDPPGTKESYYFRAAGLLKSVLGAMPGWEDGMTTISWDRANKKAYLLNPVSTTTGGYVEGTISDDGKKLTVQLPQLIGFLTGYDEDNDPVKLPIYVSVMKKVELPGGEISYEPLPDAQNVAEYSIADDGVSLTMTSPYQADFETNAQGQMLMPEKYLSMYYVYPKSLWEQLAPGEEDVDVMDWYIYGNLNMYYGPLPSDIVTYDIPANLDWNTNWRVSGDNGATSKCKVAIQGDNFYVGDLIEGSSAVVVGTRQGDQVVFKNNQYMGINPQYNRFMLLQGVDAQREYDADNKEYYYNYELNGEDMVFNWDADNNELVFEGINKGWVLNTSFVRVLYYSVYKDPEIVLQSDADVCVAPERPHLDGWWPSNPGTHVLSVTFDNVAPSGAVLDRNNLYFSMYIDDELFTFTKSQYRLSQDMTEVPINTDKGKISIIGGITYITVFDEDIEGKNLLGICTVNNAPDGKKYYSTMTAIRLDGSGIEQVDADVFPTSVNYFDLQGREVKTPAPGQMLLKVAKFADGTVRVTKEVK